MRRYTIIPGILLSLFVQTVAFASMGRAEFDEQLASAIAKLNREAVSGSENAYHLAELIRREYGTNEDQLKWAAEESLNWGEIAVFAYIHATTGRSFEEITRGNARDDFWTYAESAGMNCDKMAHSLNSFLKQAERERNSRIFERLRASRRVHPLPDLGNGFGLFQEALDFRRIDSPGPVKIHTNSGARVGGKGGQ
jgi:hypothetical protein